MKESDDNLSHFLAIKLNRRTIGLLLVNDVGCKRLDDQVN